LLSRTVADKVAGLFDEMVPLDDVSVTFAALDVPVAENPNALLVMIAPLTVAVAVTESAPVRDPGLRVMLAIPLASVSAVAEVGKKVPKLVPCVANETTTPDSAAPEPFFRVTLRSAGVAAETEFVDPVSTSVGVAATVVVVVLELLLPDPPPPQALSSANSAIRMKDEIARDEVVFKMSSCLWKDERRRS
jgi:hypothetical protein